jgi:hypothetical protein
MKLQKIIHQLSPADFNNFSEQLKATKADKFLLLLNHYRNGGGSETDEIILNKLEMKQAAFYTLKSRLFDKVQELLYKNTSDTRIELLLNTANIEHLVYKTPRETAIGILKKLEAELLEHDMPNELINVYKALKKLHIHSEKYYDYLQLYNRYVAFNLAQDKAEEILSLFCKTLGDYKLSRNEETLNLLFLYKKEMTNVCRLYQSHHLHIYKNILFIHFALFCPIENEMDTDPTVEEMLKESTSIIDSHSEDRIYKHFKLVFDFLHFEYYHQLNLHKNASKYFENITEDSECLLLLNHSSFVYHYLISKIEYFHFDKIENKLINEEEISIHEPNIHDTSSYTIYHFYKASAEFYAEKYSAAIQTLNKLINEISYKNQPFAEIEIKSFLTLLNIICERHDQAEIIIRSISRKIINEDNPVKYHNANKFLKLLKTSVSPKDNEKKEKIFELNASFESSNTGKYAFLKAIKLDEKNILLLCK